MTIFGPKSHPPKQIYGFTSASRDRAATFSVSSFMSRSDPRLWQSTFWHTKQVCFINNTPLFVCYLINANRSVNAISGHSAAILLLRQDFLDELETRRQILVFRLSEIEIFFPLLQAVESIDVVFRNIISARVVCVGPSEFLQRGLTFARKKPVDEHLCRIGMGRAVGNAECAACGARAAALLPILGIEIADRQLLLHRLADFAAGIAANTQSKFPGGQPIGHLARIPAHRHLHFAVKFFEKRRAELRMKKKKFENRGHTQAGRIEGGHIFFSFWFSEIPIGI